MQKSLVEIAQIIQGRVAYQKDEQIQISGITNIESARQGDIIFADEGHALQAQASQASAVILPEHLEEKAKEIHYAKPIIFVKNNPREAFAKLLGLFTAPLTFTKGVSDKSFIGDDVELGEGCVIMPFAVVDHHAKIGKNVKIYPHVYVGQYAEIGDDVVLHASVSIREYCKIGSRVQIHNNTVIGSDGFGYTTANDIHTKVPQVGNVVIEDDVEIGSQVGIDRATTGSTIIGQGTKIDNLVHIGHNCQLGKNCLVVAQTGLSGSTIVGDNVTFGGQVGTVGHIKIGGHSVYAARSGIISNMPEGVVCAGFPVQSHQSWLRMQAALKHLPELRKKITQLEKLLAEKNK